LKKTSLHVLKHPKALVAQSMETLFTEVKVLPSEHFHYLSQSSWICLIGNLQQYTRKA